MGDQDAAAQAIAAATRTVAEAIALIETLDDPDAAFHQATQMWVMLDAAIDTNSLIRARAAAAVAATFGLGYIRLARRLSTPEHPISRARVEQLLKTARAAEEG